MAIASYSDGGVPIERFGFLTLLPLSGKGVDKEPVTLIQHPGGLPKQIAIRESQIMELDPKQFPNVPQRFIHYSTDTEPMASCSNSP